MRSYDLTLYEGLCRGEMSMLVIRAQQLLLPSFDNLKLMQVSAGLENTLIDCTAGSQACTFAYYSTVAFSKSSLIGRIIRLVL